MFQHNCIHMQSNPKSSSLDIRQMCYNYTMGYNATLFKMRTRSTRKISAEMLS